MTIPLTGTGGLFTRLGKVLAEINYVNLFRGNGQFFVGSASRAASTTVTLNTYRTHGLIVGDTITVTGANIAAYNGSFTVATVPSTTQITYTSGSSATDSLTITTAVYVFKTQGAGSVPVQGSVDSLFSTLTTVDQNTTSTLYPARDAYRTSHTTYVQALQNFAQTLLIQMAQEDTPQPSPTLANSMALLISQMTTAAASVQKPTISVASTFTGTGTGTLGVSLLQGTGLQADYQFTEPILFTCVSDGQSGGVAGQEAFNITGPAPETDPLFWDWPLGSGVGASISSVDLLVSGGSNTLTNGSFATQTVANTPDNWPITTGTAGTTIVAGGGASNALRGTQSIGFAGNASELTNIYQPFGLSPGTPTTLLPNTQYAVFLATKVSVVPAAGVLEVALTDQAGNILNDGQAVANSTTVSLPGSTTSFATKVVFFRTPAVMPTTTRLRIRLSTALSSGTTAYFQVAMTQVIPVYAGGPSPAIFAGATNFIAKDLFTTTIANLYNSQWQAGFERLYGMRTLGQQLPSAGSPTIADTLIA